MDPGLMWLTTTVMILTRISGEGMILVVVPLVSGIALCWTLNDDPKLSVFGHQSRRFFGCKISASLLLP